MRATRTRERGAALVEFAILVPLLVLLLMGIIEFGWLFGQYNDVRHAAREGARFAAVDGGDGPTIAARVCGATEGFGAGIESLRVVLEDSTSGSRGENATISVTAMIGSLTSAPIITSFTPEALTSEVVFSLERPSTAWADYDGTSTSCTFS